VHIPLLIVIVTGDLLAGEAHGGTFRVLLTRPVSRPGLITAKFIAAILYTFLIVLFLAVLSLGLGIAFFGKGDLLVVMGAVNIIPADDALWRFIAAFGFGFLSMATVAALSIFLSAMASNSLGPILSTMAIVMIFTLMSTLNLGFFKAVEPYLFTTYLVAWQDLFYFDIDYNKVLADAAILTGHIVLFYSLTVIYFKRKDILT